MDTIDIILNQFDTSLEKYQSFKLKMEDLVNDLLKSENIVVHNVSARVKDKDSLEKKIKKKTKYNRLSEITDIVGLRIITLFEDEVDSVAKLISDEFEIDPDNSIDKRIKNYDQFGYASLHYVASLKDPRVNLIEYKEYRGLMMEIQIRSILQHSWAEIEHDIGYKSKEEIPDIAKRNFARIAALLETADIEFIRLRTQLSRYVADLVDEIKKDPESVDLNVESLKVFANLNTIISKLDKRITEAVHSTLIRESELDTGDIPKLIFLGINNIKQLGEALEKREDKIVDFAVAFMSDHSHENAQAQKGISLTYLCYLLIAEKESNEQLSDFLKAFYREGWFEYLVERVKSSFRKINTKHN